MNPETPEDHDSFWGHTDALRSTLIAVFLSIASGIVIALFFYQSIFAIITAPLRESQTSHSLVSQTIRRERLSNTTSQAIHYIAPGSAAVYPSPDSKEIANRHYLIPPGAHIDLDRIEPVAQLAVLGPIDGFTTILRVSFWAGIVISSPVWLYFLVSFIRPGLYNEERRLILPFLTMSAIFLSIGIMTAYYITIPFANNYLFALNNTIGVNWWTVSHYLDYTLFLILANGVAFELGVVMLFLVHIGLFTSAYMIYMRRYMIVAAFILGAILTPPDIMTQLLVAFPLIGLYELTIFYAKFRERKDQTVSV
jgi:sec-independent protein translocase protein TatC